MIRDDNRALALEDIGAMLHRKNGLVGELRITQSKKFTARDKTKNGQSMAGWRLVQLEGDDRFLKCLDEFPEDHKFKLGGSLVMIRGGKRKAAAPTGGNATTLGQRGQGLGQQSRNRSQGGSEQQGQQQQNAAGNHPTEEQQDQQEQQQQEQPIELQLNLP